MATVYNFDRELVDGYTINFVQDYEIENPREGLEYNRVKLYGAYGRETIGDEYTTPDRLAGILSTLLGVDDDYSLRELVELADASNRLFVAPFYMLVHSGWTVSTHPFGDVWDSGVAGYGVVCRDDIKDIVFKDAEEFKTWAQKCFEQEIEVYDDYLTGNCWSYAIEDEDGLVIDSCGGFYGDDIEKNGMLDYIEPYLVPENTPEEQVTGREAVSGR